MIRKTVNIFMSLVFLLSTTGFTVSKHFCGNNFVNFTINTEAETCCEMGGGCCRTESEHYQLEQEFVGPFVVNQFQDSDTDLLLLITISTLSLELGEEENIETEFTDLSPPPKIQTKLSLLQTYLC